MSAVLIRHGQTASIVLAYTVNGETLADYAPDELEFMFGGVQYLLSDGGIVWSDDENAFVVELDQTATFALPSTAQYQLRVLKDGVVGVSDIESVRIGAAISREVLS